MGIISYRRRNCNGLRKDFFTRFFSKFFGDFFSLSIFDIGCCVQKRNQCAVVRQFHPQFRCGAAGLAGEAGVGADDGERGGIEGASSVGFLDCGVADGLRIEFALDHDKTGGGGDEEIGAEVTGASHAADRVTGGGEEVADEVFVVRAGRDRREVAAPFEIGASERGRIRSGAAVAIGRAPFRTPARASPAATRFARGIFGRRAAGALGFTVNHRRRIW